jgi:heme/copper-type cytochrome/quinol oxidase subunit 3
VIIPYTTERRADTGLTNVALGVWLFIASEVMLFGALFSAYALLRAGAESWPSGRQILSLPLGLVNTVVLLALTTLVWRARRAAPAAAPRWLLVASALALLFSGLKSFEYAHDVARGLVPAASTFLAMYFTLTGLHALHVLAGLAGNLWAVAGAGRNGADLTAGRVRALSVYWTFVDVVWLGILLLVYLS